MYLVPFRVIPPGCVSFMFSVQLSKQNWKQNWSSFTSFCSISPPIRMATHHPLHNSSSSAPHHIISYHICPSIHPATLLSTLTHSSSIYSSIHSVCVDTVVHLKHLCLFACFNAIHTTSSVRSTNPTAISVFPHIKKPRPRFCCCPRALPRPSPQRCWTYCCRLFGVGFCAFWATASVAICGLTRRVWSVAVVAYKAAAALDGGWMTDVAMWLHLLKGEIPGEINI